MAKFSYKFETIRKVKEQLKEKIQKEIAIVNLEIKKLQEEIFELSNNLNCEREKILSRENIKVSELHFFSKYEVYTSRLIKGKKKKIYEFENRKIKMKEELIQKAKEKKIFETLKEKHLEDFKKSQDKIEQLQIDEIAVNGFNKGNL